MSLYDEGSHESLKAFCHGLTIPPALIGVGYNWQVWLSPRGNGRHVFNVLLYAAIVAYEFVNVAEHLRKR